MDYQLSKKLKEAGFPFDFGNSLIIMQAFSFARGICVQSVNNSILAVNVV